MKQQIFRKEKTKSQMKLSWGLFLFFLFICPNDFYIRSVGKQEILFAVLWVIAFIWASRHVEDEIIAKRKRQNQQEALILYIKDQPKTVSALTFTLLSNHNTPIDLSEALINDTSDMRKRNLLQTTVINGQCLYYLNPNLYKNVNE